MKILYVLRVCVLSVEAVLLAIAWLAWITFPDEIQDLAKSLAVNQDVLKYLMLLPPAIAVWIFNECRSLLQEDKDTIRVLTAWNDYWRLKVHVWVALLYALIFTLISFVPWLTKSGVETGAGLLFFVLSIVGQFLVAASIYVGRIRLKELVVQVKSP